MSEGTLHRCVLIGRWGIHVVDACRLASSVFNGEQSYMHLLLVSHNM